MDIGEGCLQLAGHLLGGQGPPAVHSEQFEDGDAESVSFLAGKSMPSGDSR